MVYIRVLNLLHDMVVNQGKSYRGLISHEMFDKKLDEITLEVGRLDGTKEERKYQQDLRLWKYYFTSEHGAMNNGPYATFAFPGVPPVLEHSIIIQSTAPKVNPESEKFMYDLNSLGNDEIENTRREEEELTDRDAEREDAYKISNEQKNTEHSKASHVNETATLSSRIERLKAEALELERKAESDYSKRTEEAAAEYERVKRAAMDERTEQMRKVTSIHSEIDRLKRNEEYLIVLEQEAEKVKKKILEATKEYEDLQQEAKRLRTG